MCGSGVARESPGAGGFEGRGVVTFGDGVAPVTV